MKFKWTLRLTLLTPLIMITSIITAGGGHGTPIPAMFCYPILFLLKAFESSGGPLVWGVLLGQFPVYGLVIDIGKLTSWQRLSNIALLSFHSILVLAAIYFKG